MIASWLLDLTATAFVESPDLHEFGGRVSDSGEGRWTAEAALALGVPTPVLTTALHSRFASQGAAKDCFELGGGRIHLAVGAWEDQFGRGARYGLPQVRQKLRGSWNLPKLRVRSR